MPPKSRRICKVKKGTLNYALELCDKAQLISIISKKEDLDAKAGVEVMNIVKRSRQMYKHSLTPLQGAVSLGHYTFCKYLVEEGAMLESTTNIAHPLCLALEKGHFDIADFLIKSGAHVELAFEDRLPISFALDLEVCPVDIIRTIIEAGFPVNKVIEGSTGKTALHEATIMNHPEIVSYLLSLPVDVNQVDRRGLTPLHYAVQKNFATIVTLLVEAGARIDCECLNHFTPMLYAIDTQNYDMVKLLLTLGADIHYVNDINGSPICSMMPLHFAANLCRLKITQLLLESGADVSKTIPLTREIPLHSAARANTRNNQANRVSLDCIVELLINAKSDIEARQKLGLTPLQIAIKAKNYYVAKVLILNGADLNSIMKENFNDDQRCTTFHIVAKTFDTELIKLCLDYGADYMSKDSDSKYPCHRALINAILDVFSHSSDCCQSLQAKHNHNEQLELAVFKIFWKYGFPFDLTLDIKWLKPNMTVLITTITSAVQKQRMLFKGIVTQNLKMVQKAIGSGAEVKACSKDLLSPLHFISAKGNEQILKEFVTRGVPVNSLNKNGETPLHQAARAGHVNCCRLLLEHGAVYNYSTTRTRSPLELAKEKNQTEVVVLLTMVDKYFKEMKKGNLRKLKPEMKLFTSVMNCCRRDGKTLLATAVHLSMSEAASRLIKLRWQMPQ